MDRHARRWIGAAVYAAAAAVSLYYKDQILDWIQRSDGTQLVPLTLLALLLALVPVVPYGIVAGLMGAKFGVVLGGLLNLFASSAAAGLMFLLARFVLQQAARGLLPRFKRLDRFTAIYGRNPFIAVLFARLIPVIPAPAVNIYSAVTRISGASFMAATLIGKMPVMLVFAFVGEQLFSNMRNALIVAGVYIVFLLIVFAVYRLWRRRSLHSDAYRSPSG